MLRYHSVGSARKGVFAGETKFYAVAGVIAMTYRG